MSERIFYKAMTSALSAFNRGYSEFDVCGITLHIQHAHHNNYQVLLPEGCGMQDREVFRIFENGADTVIVPV